MALFSLGDITINKGDDIRKGPLAPLTQSKYNNKNYRFLTAKFLVKCLHKEKKKYYAIYTGLNTNQTSL